MLWPAVHRPQILALLLERGADLKRAPGCLELATSIISTESVQILLANGAGKSLSKSVLDGSSWLTLDYQIPTPRKTASSPPYAQRFAMTEGN